MRWMWMIVALFGLILAGGVAGCGHTPLDSSHAGEQSDSTAYNGLMAIYEGPLNHLYAVRKGSCPMYPSCSAYSRQAVAAHGPVVGWIMTMDRLMRCGRNETQNVPQIFIEGQWKYFDPLEANDRWWSGPEKDVANLAEQVPDSSTKQ
jgi:putative component of membrane protein insertase Oxa1/YidC/SpoIIIJ protein YidD